MRPLVVAVLDLARQLRQRHDRHVELLGERLEVGGDLGHLLHAIFLGAAGRALQQLNVVDDQEIHPLLAFQPPGTRGQLRHRQPAGLVDEERQVLQLDRDVLDLLEIPFGDAAAPDGARRDAALLGDDAGGELLGRHFEREEADDAAVDRVDMAVGAHLAAPSPRHVVGDVGGERGLAHAGTAGDDDQVGGLQPAHLGVEVPEAGRQARELAVALVGARRHVDGGGQRAFEFLEAAAVAPDLGEVVEALLGVLDLLARREIDRRVEGDVDHVLADLDQVAPDGEVVDGAPVVHRIDDGRGLGGEAGEVLSDRQAGNVDLGRQKGLQGHRRGELSGADQAAGNVVDLLVDRLEEVLRLEKIADPVERLVVDQDGAQQRLLRLDIVRGGAIVRGGWFRLFAGGRIERCHGSRSGRLPIRRKSGAFTPRADSGRRLISAVPGTHRMTIVCESRPKGLTQGIVARRRSATYSPASRSDGGLPPSSARKRCVSRAM